jgi:hypothetical protein
MELTGGRLIKMTWSEKYITATGSWVCPAGVTKVLLIGCGGGAGGGGGAPAQNESGGGAGGGGSILGSQWITVSPNTSYTVTVGAGGTGGASNQKGNNGSNTTFGSLATFNGGIATPDNTIGSYAFVAGGATSINWVQSITGAVAFSTSSTVTFTNAVNAGDLLCCVTRAGSSGSLTTVKDNINGNWIAVTNGVSGAEQLFYFNGSSACAANTMIITVSNSGTASTIRIVADDFTGGYSWNLVTSANGAPSLTAGTFGTILTTSSVSAGDLLYAGGTTGTDSVIWTAGSGLIIGGSQSSSTLGSSFSEYSLGTSSGAQSPQIKANASATASCGVAIFSYSKTGMGNITGGYAGGSSGTAVNGYLGGLGGGAGPGGNGANGGNASNGSTGSVGSNASANTGAGGGGGGAGSTGGAGGTGGSGYCYIIWTV